MKKVVHNITFVYISVWGIYSVVALLNFHLVFFKLIKNFFTIFLKLSVFLLWIPAGICAIHRCPPECLLIVACVRTPSLANVSMCTIAFTTVSYKCPRCNCRSERVCAHFWTILSGEALTSMPHLLRVGNLFLRCITLTLHGCNRSQPNGPFLSM